MASTRRKQNKKRRVFGCRLDGPDDRDEAIELEEAHATKAHLDKRLAAGLTPPPVWQQLPLLSCTAHTVAAALWYSQAISMPNEAPVDPSRMFIFYHALLRQQQEE